VGVEYGGGEGEGVGPLVRGAARAFGPQPLPPIAVPQADTGTKMIHVGRNTRSRIVSKGISAGKSRNVYRGQGLSNGPVVRPSDWMDAGPQPLTSRAYLESVRGSASSLLPRGFSPRGFQTDPGAGLVQVGPTAVGARNHSQCDSARAPRRQPLGLGTASYPREDPTTGRDMPLGPHQIACRLFSSPYIRLNATHFLDFLHLSKLSNPIYQIFSSSY